MANNRELSQLGSFIDVDNNNGNIGIATLATPSVGIGTTSPEEKLHVVGNVKADEFIGGGINLTGIITAGGASYTGGTVLSNLKVTGLSTFVGVVTTQSDLFIGGDLDFKGSLYQDGRLYTSGVGIGSTTVNAESGDVGYRIGIGFTDVNFVGSGLTITGYGSTVVVDFNNLSVRADATIPPLTLLNSSANLDSNKGYLTNTVGAGFTVTLPLSKNAGDFVEIHDTESCWDINNLMVATQNNEQFKNYTGTIDSPLACDVAGATVKLVWTNTYWRVFA